MSGAIPPEIVARFAELRRRVEEDDPAIAERARRDLLDLARTSLGRDRVETAVAEVELADWLVDRGRNEEAIEMLQHAVRVLGRASRDVGLWHPRALLLLGEAYDRSGQDVAAMDRYRVAYHHFVALAGDAHPGAMQAALNCAEVLRVAHDFEAAERWFRRALAIARAPEGDRSLWIAHASNNLAETLLAMGRTEEAVALADDALAIRVARCGERSPDASRSRGVVARIALARGDDARLHAAIEASRDAVDHDVVTLPIDVVAAYLAQEGRVEDAIAAIEAALERLDHPDAPQDASALPHQRIDLRFLLARLLRDAGRAGEALRRMREGFELDTLRLSDDARVRSRRQMRALLRASRARLGEALRLAVEGPHATEDDRRALCQVLQQRKGLETRLLTLQKKSFITDRALTAAPPEVVERVGAHVERLLASLAEVRAEMQARLLRLVRDGADPRVDPTVIEQREDEEAIERAIAGFVGAGSLEWTVSGVTSDVPAVGDGEAVVEYVLVEAPEPAYFAFVVSAQGVQLADLGDATSIDEGIRQLRGQLIDEPVRAGEREPRWRRRARFVSNRLLAPLLPWLDGVTQLLVVPDGALFSLPFDLLPLEGATSVIDRWSLSFLWNGGELNGRRMVFGSIDAPGGALVVSAPDTAHGSDGATHRFAPLPFADAEGEAIAAMVGGERLRGARATKEALLGAERPELVHLATHGFWIDGTASAAPVVGGSVTSGGDVATGGASPVAQEALLFQARALLDDPLLRSGIALAGADAALDAPTADASGILFAAEVLDLDLRQTDLVVMSSCQSGIGDPSPGDGVQGLRRAFRAAGAESVVSSLWKVPDESTAALMQAFYTRLLAKRPRGAALHQAKRAMRDRHPEDPLHWAGFVLDGATGPLFRFSPIRGLRVATLSGVGLSLDTAREHLAKGEWDAALRSLDFILESSTADAELRATAAYEKAGALRQSGRPAEALPIYDAMIQRPDTPVNLMRSATADRALTKYLLGDLEGARLDYTAFLLDGSISDARRAFALANRAAVLARLGERALAIADCEAALQIDGVPPEIREIAQGNLDALRAPGHL